MPKSSPIFPALRCALALALAAGSAAGAEPGARDALRVLEEARGAALLLRVVALLGWNGDDQPSAWRILVAGAAPGDDYTEFEVSGGAVTAERPWPRTPGDGLPEKPVLTGLLTVDSTQAYRIADDEAILAGVTLSKLHYQLRFRGHDPHPTWLVTVVDPAGATVGEVVIDAHDGTIPYQDFPGTSLVAAAPETSVTPASAAAYQAEPERKRLRSLLTPSKSRPGSYFTRSRR
jgi:hypothetical protein